MEQSYRILLLGAGGFVGQHLRAELENRCGQDTHVLATGLHAKPGVTALNVTDAVAIRAILQDYRPTHIFNLAGIASPVAARRDPDFAWLLHAQAPERLGRMLIEDAPDCWLFQVGSGLVYGQAALGGAPVDESVAPRPMDPYGVTKTAGDLALGALANEGLRCVCMRPFNHTGPGQTEAFAIPAFAAQIARIEHGLPPPEIRVGNLDTIRDFSDVRDVVRAYVDLMLNTAAIIPGSIFNVASGRGISMSDLLRILVEQSNSVLTITSDPERQRKSDLPVIIGDASALRRMTGWRPKIPIEDTMRAVLNSFRQEQRMK